LLLRQERQPKPIHDIAWKGQLRLCARYRRLARTGKPANVVTKAREISQFGDQRTERHEAGELTAGGCAGSLTLMRLAS
jgi:hypothetical protein